MLRNLLAICLALIFTAAYAPAASDVTQPQSVDSVEASETTHEDDHDAEDDHGDEDADEHGSEADEHDDDIEEHEHDDEGEHRELGAHEHGAAELMIAWSGDEIAIDLQTPAYNVLGFEYAPATDEEKAFLAESVAALEAGNLLQLNPDAECTLVSADVQTKLAEEDHDEEVHSDIDASYNLACQQPDDIESLDANALFVQFPNFEDIQVQWISDTQQSAAILTPDDPVLSFK